MLSAALSLTWPHSGLQDSLIALNLSWYPFLAHIQSGLMILRRWSALSACQFSIRTALIYALTLANPNFTWMSRLANLFPPPLDWPHLLRFREPPRSFDRPLAWSHPYLELLQALSLSCFQGALAWICACFAQFSYSKFLKYSVEPVCCSLSVWISFSHGWLDRTDLHFQWSKWRSSRSIWDSNGFHQQYLCIFQVTSPPVSPHWCFLSFWCPVYD